MKNSHNLQEMIKEGMLDKGWAESVLNKIIWGREVEEPLRIKIQADEKH